MLWDATAVAFLYEEDYLRPLTASKILICDCDRMPLHQHIASAANTFSLLGECYRVLLNLQNSYIELMVSYGECCKMLVLQHSVLDNLHPAE